MNARDKDFDGSARVGADLVEARGGEVVIIPLVAGQSTTSIIARSRSGA